MHRAQKHILKENVNSGIQSFTNMFLQIIGFKFVEIDFIYLLSPTIVQVLNYMQREHAKNASSFF